MTTALVLESGVTGKLVLSPLPFVLGHRTGPFGTVPKDQVSLGPVLVVQDKCQSPGSLSPRIKDPGAKPKGCYAPFGSGGGVGDRPADL